MSLPAKRLRKRGETSNLISAWFQANPGPHTAAEVIAAFPSLRLSTDNVNGLIKGLLNADLVRRVSSGVTYEWIGPSAVEQTAGRDALEAALREMVTLIDMKADYLRRKQLRANRFGPLPHELRDLWADCKRRQPVALAKARELLSKRCGE